CMPPVFNVQLSHPPSLPPFLFCSLSLSLPRTLSLSPSCFPSLPLPSSVYLRNECKFTPFQMGYQFWRSASNCTFQGCVCVCVCVFVARGHGSVSFLIKETSQGALLI